jgi:hypothetical protein
MATRNPLADLSTDRRGATALMTGLMLTVVLGFVGFGIDFGTAFTARRAAQSAADSAAFSAAVAKAGGTADITGQARAVTARYGLVNGAGAVTVSVNQPPTSGAYLNHPEATEVIIVRPAPRIFASLFQTGATTISARAVAATLPNKDGDGCVVAFNPIDSMAILANGNPNVTLENCAIDANSASPQAMSMNGTPIITAKAANIVGGLFKNGPVQLNAQVNLGAKATPDPYNNPAFKVDLPDYPAGHCDSTNALVNSKTPKTFTPNGQPYVFCNGLTINGSANVTFAPGVYVIDGGSLTINGNATIRGTGVAFVLTNHTGSNIATVTINGGADINLSAPAPGASMAGFVFYQDRRAGLGQDTLNGGAKQIFKGALYFPKQTVLLNGGTDVAGNGGCTQVLADKVTFNGDARLATNCANVGTQGIGQFVTTLVE